MWCVCPLAISAVCGPVISLPPCQRFKWPAPHCAACTAHTLAVHTGREREGERERERERERESQASARVCTHEGAVHTGWQGRTFSHSHARRQTQGGRGQGILAD